MRKVGYRILEYLAESYPRVVSRSELALKIWGDSPPGFRRSANAHLPAPLGAR
ncbi:MAG: winged helix-turn-helix domain-containing protein [Myxococcota bacterium]